jgi:hypothetical protein
MEELVQQIKPRLEEHLDAFVIVGLTVGSHERVSFGSVNRSRLIRKDMEGISESALLWSALEDQGKKQMDKSDPSPF